MRYKKLAPSSARRYYVVLQSVLHTAYKLELINTNPADGGKLALPPLNPPKTEIFKKQEAETLLGYLSSEPLMYQVLIQLAIVTGARRGKLVALTWENIDFVSGTVSINKSSYQIKGEGIRTKKPETWGASGF